MKTIGVIGGLGPKTTSEFYLSLIDMTQRLNKVNRIPMLIYSVPLPFDVEEDSVLRSEGEERICPILIKGAKLLEQGGVDFLVMPCNSLHVFIEDIRNAVSIPALSIVEETVKFLQTKNINKIGLLSTALTRKNKIYENAFNQAGIAYFVPSDPDQNLLNEIIHRLIMGSQNNDDKAVMESVIDAFTKDGVEHVILACTDLQLVGPQHKTIQIYDTMTILKDASATYILS